MEQMSDFPGERSPRRWDVCLRGTVSGRRSVIRGKKLSSLMEGTIHIGARCHMMDCHMMDALHDTPYCLCNDLHRPGDVPWVDHYAITKVQVCHVSRKHVHAENEFTLSNLLSQ